MMTWRELLANLPSMSEDEVKQMLDEECAGARRLTIMLRLSLILHTLRSSLDVDAQALGHWGHRLGRQARRPGQPERQLPG